MYVQPVFGDTGALLAIAVKEHGHVECTQGCSGQDARRVKWLEKKVGKSRGLVFYDAEDLYRLNANAIVAGVDISCLSRKKIVAIVQDVHSVARLQQVFRAYPTVKQFAEVLNYPQWQELVERRADLSSLPPSRLRCRLSDLLQAIAYIHRALRGYCEAGQTLRRRGGLWR